jgi:hypothetical protein
MFLQISGTKDHQLLELDFTALQTAAGIQPPNLIHLTIVPKRAGDTESVTSGTSSPSHYHISAVAGSRSYGAFSQLMDQEGEDGSGWGTTTKIVRNKGGTKSAGGTATARGISDDGRSSTRFQNQQTGGDEGEWVQAKKRAGGSAAHQPTSALFTAESQTSGQTTPAVSGRGAELLQQYGGTPPLMEPCGAMSAAGLYAQHPFCTAAVLKDPAGTLR